MKSDRQLAYWYGKYNRIYFGGELPEVTIFWEPSPNSYGLTDKTEDSFVVKLDPALKGFRDYWHILLLHEMVHVKLWPKHPNHQHGRAFQEEMKRLANQNAFRKLW